MEGYIQLHRKLLEWEWYDDTPTFKLFIHCLLKANYTDKKWRGNDIKRGQFITSISNLSHETGLSQKQVRSSIDKLVKTGELGKLTTHRNSMITVLSYNNYQKEGKPKGKPKGELMANLGQSEGKLRATTNKDNKDNNIINNNILDFVKLLFFINQKTGRKFKTINDQVKRKYKARLKDGYTKEDILNSIINASNLQYHKDNGCQYLTPEFFSRQDTLDKYGNEAKGNLIASFPDPVN